MRNKVFVIFFSVVFILLFLGAPLSVLLTKWGIIEYNNVGNEITKDKFYNEEKFMGRVLDGFEELKVDIKDTYINNLPFYLKITEVFKPLENNIDQPVIDWLQKKGAESYSALPCKHIWEELRVEPTCTESGSSVEVCRLCQEKGREKSLDPMGHTLTYVSKTEPSCESDGYTLYSCSVCDDNIQMDLVESLGHKYELVFEEPATCTKEGIIEYNCSVCNTGYSVDTVPTEHSYENGICTLCGKVNADSEHQHSYKAEVIEPTCTESGYTLYTCTCAHSYKENQTPPAGHKYSATVVPPTCKEGGYTLYTCASCSDSYKDNESAIGAHKYSEKVIKPTKTEGGYSVFTCEYCGDSYEGAFTEKLADIPEPVTTPDPEGTTYTASYKSTDNIFRHYAISAKSPDGNVFTTYARIVKLDRDTLYENMLNTVKMVNAMVEKDRSINWYFYFPTNIEVTQLAEKIIPEESTRHIYEEFLSKLDPSVKTDALLINSFTDYYNKFYITDHHWNHEGFNEAYLDIVRMFNENYSDIVPFELEGKYVFEDVEFHGSLSRTHADYTTSDLFGLYYYNMPQHSVITDRAISYGAKSSLSKKIKEYSEGKFNTASGYYHYTDFFRVCKEITLDEGNTGRNLLLIGDSYSLPLLEIVGCYFDNTYVRYEDRGWNNFPEELLYEDFIKENNITDVLVIEEPAKCIMQGYGDAYPSGFLNIYPDENW